MTHCGIHLLTECGVPEDYCYLNIEQRAWPAAKGLAVHCTAAWLMALRTIECTLALCRAECLPPPGPTVELAQTLAGKWRSLDFCPVSFLRLHPLWGHVSALTLRAACGLSRNQAPHPGYEVGKVEAERGYDTQWMQSLPLRWYLGCQCTPLNWANPGDLNQRTALLQYGVPLGSGHLDQGTTPVFCPPCRPDLSEGGAVKAIPGLLLR